MLAQPDRKNLLGQRDHALLALLYNTGGRISEVLALCPRAIRLDTPAQVHLVGKGRKERTCPLWPETTALLTALLKRQPRPWDEPIFVNRHGRPLGASGTRFRLKKYVRSAARQAPRIADKRVSPHYLSPHSRRASDRGRCRCRGGPKFARSRESGHDKSLRPSESGDQEEGNRAGGRGGPTREAATLEAAMPGLIAWLDSL